MHTQDISLRKAFTALLSQGKTDVLLRLARQMHPVDLAGMLAVMNAHEQKAIFQLLPADLAAAVLDEAEAELQTVLLETVNRESVRDLVNRMSDDEVADMLRALEGAQADRLLSALLAEDAADLRTVLARRRNSAGALMTTAFVAISRQIMVRDALAEVRRQVKDAETIYSLYVLDKQERLVGVLSLRELLVAARDEQVEEIMRSSVVSITDDADQEEAAELIRRYRLSAIPVVDAQGKMLGIVTVDDALDVMEAEATEDIHKMAGITTSANEEDVLLSAPVWKAAARRLPWLIICLAGDLISGSVIKGFEAALQAVVALAFYIPVLMATGGNVGTQSLAIAVRGLATGDMNKKTFARHIAKESLAGLWLGLICGPIVGLIAWLTQGDLALGLVVGITMWLTLTLSALVGMLIPVLFHAVNVDPAVASGPFITTVVDINALLIYFFLSTTLMKGILS